MSAVQAVGGSGLQRPYTHGTFQRKLNQFERLIADITQQDSDASPEEKRQAISEGLRYEQFCESIRSLFGPDIRNQDLKAIFRKISTNPDAKVDWSELFGYFQSEVPEAEPAMTEDASVFTVSFRTRVGDAAGDRKRRDIAQAIIHLKEGDFYITASQKGTLSIYNSKDTAWVTGCDYLPRLRRVANIFTIKPMEHSPQCMAAIPGTDSTHDDTLLFGDDQGIGPQNRSDPEFTTDYVVIFNSPTFKMQGLIPPARQVSASGSQGVGFVNMMTIASKDLHTKHSKGERKNTNPIIEPSKLSNPILRRKLHDDWVLKIKYFPELRCFGSCSPSSLHSFVLDDLDRIKDNQPVRSLSVSKGINTFAYCARANVIATGGVDKIIRIWHPNIFSRPTGKMIGHLFTIVEMVVNEKDQHLISLSTARVFRVWDIHTLTSLQVFTDNEERPGEKRIYSMAFDSKHDRLLTGSSVIDQWPLTRAVQDTMQVPHTHDRPISQVVHNKELNQVVSICTESVLKVWEMDTGKLVYTIVDAHGPNVEVTSVAFDKTGYRMATGALDGSIKVWDFGSGQEIKVLPALAGEKDEEAGVTALAYVLYEEQRCITALGWNNRLRLIEDSGEVGELNVLLDFVDLYCPRDKSSRSSSRSGSDSPLSRSSIPQVTKMFEKENVLQTHELKCTTMLPPDQLATGCTNGNILIWDIQRTVVKDIWRLDEDEDEEEEEENQENSPSRSRAKSANPHSVHACRFLVHRTRRPDPAYIKRLTRHHAVREDMPTEEDETEGSRRASMMSERSRSQTMTMESRTHSFIDSRMSQAKTPDQDQAGTESRMSGVPQSGMDGNVRISEPMDAPATGAGTDEGERESQTAGDPVMSMIETTYEPVLVSCHHDALIRFWSMKPTTALDFVLLRNTTGLSSRDAPGGEMLREVSALTRRQGSPVTAVCADDDCNLLITADHKGYITMWDVAIFLEDPTSENKDNIRQLICWRGHLNRIVSLFYTGPGFIVSGSTDGSVRVWYKEKGHFIGFFGQHRIWKYPTEPPSSAVFPYDITERPLEATRRLTSREKAQQKQKFEYPLIKDMCRWAPFRRSAYERQQKVELKPLDIQSKFFATLIKPRAYTDHLDRSKTGDAKEGAVYRALPVYRVEEPDRMRTPNALKNPFMPDEDDNTFLFGNLPKKGKTKEGSTESWELRKYRPVTSATQKIVTA
ncbi:WD repeat-containing protein 64 [Branchiostoma belcheri]|nr:WD repeat-containing protein 64 [Branchiostoma belcheri]